MTVDEYTQQAQNAFDSLNVKDVVPGLTGYTKDLYFEYLRMGYPIDSAINLTKQQVNNATESPVDFTKQRLADLVNKITVIKAYGNDISSYLPQLKDQSDFLQKNGVPYNDVSKIITDSESKGIQSAKKQIKDFASISEGDSFGNFLSTALPIGIAFVAPEFGAALATELGVSTAAGTAIASAALQTAAGVDPQTALQNAVTSAVVQTGSAAAATEINNAMTNMDAATKAGIANAAGSAISSGAMAAAKGGSTQDIINSALAGAAGSGVATATDDKAIGAAVTGGLTGGAMGAATAAAGAAGQPTPTTPPAPTPVSEVVVSPDVQVAGGEGLPELPQPKSGQLMVDKLGRPISIGVIEFDANGVGKLVAAPITGNAQTGYTYQVQGEPQTLTQSQYERLFYKTNPTEYLRMAQEVYGNTGNIDAINEALASGKTNISPMADQATTIEGEVREIKKSPSTFNELLNAASKIDPAAAKALMSSDVNEMAGALAVPEIKALVDKAGNTVYLQELAEAYRNAPPGGEYAKTLKEEIFNIVDKTPNLSTKEIQDIISPRLSPVQYVDLSAAIQERKVTPVTTPEYTPSTIAPSASLVVNVDPSTNKALVLSPEGKASVVSYSGDLQKDQYVNVDPQTQTATATKTYPTITAGATTGFAPGSEPVYKGQTDKTTVSETPTQPTGGGGAGGGAGGVAYVGGISEKPTEPTTPTTPSTTTADTTQAGPSTPETPKEPTDKYKPSLITGYSITGPDRVLAQALGGQPQFTGSTTGLTSYRPAGEIEPDLGTERQDVWNEASLRLKNALGI